MQAQQKQIKLIVATISFSILMLIQGALAGSVNPTEDRASASAEKKQATPIEAEFIFSSGYRKDNLDWSIAGDSSGKHPNILSELTWDDLESYQVKFQTYLVCPNIIALRGTADYGWLFDGANQDSDYQGNDRSVEFSRSNNNADDGYVWDASLAIGYPFRFGRNVLGTITPLAGYSRHEQHLTMTDGYQTIPEMGPFPGLDSSYDTQWKGPWVGFEMHFRAKEINTFAHRFETYATYEYHWADYQAEADWNLREDFDHPKSFAHDADGTGYIIGAGFTLVLQYHWALSFNFDYQNWSTDDGKDKLFLADGTVAKTQLNEVTWNSYALSLGLSLRF